VKSLLAFEVLRASQVPKFIEVLDPIEAPAQFVQPLMRLTLALPRSLLNGVQHGRDLGLVQLEVSKEVRELRFEISG
jgi:hypothetical protein